MLRAVECGDGVTVEFAFANDDETRAIFKDYKTCRNLGRLIRDYASARHEIQRRLHGALRKERGRTDRGPVTQVENEHVLSG